MREIAPILTPILFSVFVAMIFTPHIRWLKRKGISGGLSILLVNLLFGFIVMVLGIVVVGAAIQFEHQIPIYQTRLIEYNRYSHTLYSLTRRAFCEFDFTWYCIKYDLSHVEYY